MKLLLISYYFPPYNSVGGVRPGELAKYLYNQGHEIDVISAEQPFPVEAELEIPPERVSFLKGWSANAPVELLLGGREKTARSGYNTNGKASKKTQLLKKWYRDLFYWPDAEIGWVSPALKKGRELLAKKQYDLIYVSAPSHSALRVAKALSSEFSVGWVAEFRDLWTDNHYFASPSWKQWIEKKWERNLLKTASALITVSEPLAEILGHFKKPVWTIRNGYDQDDFANVTTLETGAKNELKIVFTGNLYPENNDLEVFCEGISNYRSNGGKVSLFFAGRNISPITEIADKYNLSDCLTLSPNLKRSEALALQYSADLLLLYLWKGQAQGIYGTKLFEYVGAKKPILAIGPKDNDVGTLVTSNKLGKHASSSNEVVSILQEQQTIKDKHSVLAITSEESLDFSRKTQFAKLEKLLLSIIASEQK